MKWTEMEKKQVLIFALVAFGMPVLMGIFMGYSYFQGNDISAFPTVQMYYPAAGVMLALLLTKGKETVLPGKYYFGFLLTTVIMMIVAIVSVFTPQMNWAVYSQYPIIVSSVVCLILLLFEKKEVKAQYGLRFAGKKRGISWYYIFMFLVLYFLRLLLSCVIENEKDMFVDIMLSPNTYLMMLLLVVNFFLVYTAFFGEEYGWRFFFQPMLQKRFGLKGGVLILGVLWGLWHLPINIFYYSPDTWIISVILQIITCVSFAIFFGFGYMKTENIWVAVAMHYINNNMIPVITGSTDISNQVYSWKDVPVTIIVNIVFIIFIFAKEFQEKKAEE